MKLTESYLRNYIEEKYNPDEEYLGREKEINNVEPLVSVSVTTYQHAGYIEECIESIITQKAEFPFEIIIGEDQSRDGTREICMQYAEKYPDKIRLFLRNRETSSIYNEEGKRIIGLNAKWNKKASRGKYIAICEGDDYWIDPRKLQKQVELMEKYNQCHISFHPVFMDWDGNKGEPIMHQKHSDTITIFPVQDLIINGGEFCPTTSVMIRAESKQYNYFLDGYQTQDYHSQVLASIPGGALYIDEVMAVYRKGVAGSWTEKHALYVNQCRHAFSRIKSNRLFDAKLNYSYHSAFKKREAILFKSYSVFKVYSDETYSVKEIKALIKREMKGYLKWKSYFYILLSFFYYKVNVRKLFGLRNRIKQALN